jgi:MarR family transcriptional regulator, organic hydroperoxide resistance regulator
MPRRPPPPPVPNLQEQAYLALLRTADRLQTRFAEWLKPHGLSPTQYNALRILRGAGPDGLPCSQISERMLTHDPDITRLIDRLEKRGWVARNRDKRDRRVVRARVTPEGLDLLAELDGPLSGFVRSLMAPAPAEQLRSVLATCETLISSSAPSQERQASELSSAKH